MIIQSENKGFKKPYVNFSVLLEERSLFGDLSSKVKL